MSNAASSTARVGTVADATRGRAARATSGGPYLLLRFPPPALPGTPHQHWLAKMIASVLPDNHRPGMQAALLTGASGGANVTPLAQGQLEHGLASGTLEQADLATLRDYLATEVTLARRFVASWAQAPCRREQMWRNHTKSCGILEVCQSA